MHTNDTTLCQSTGVIQELGGDIGPKLCGDPVNGDLASELDQDFSGPSDRSECMGYASSSVTRVSAKTSVANARYFQVLHHQLNGL